MRGEWDEIAEPKEGELVVLKENKQGTMYDLAVNEWKGVLLLFRHAGAMLHQFVIMCRKPPKCYRCFSSCRGFGNMRLEAR